MGSFQYPGNANVSFFGAFFMIIGMWVKSIFCDIDVFCNCRHRFREAILLIISFLILLICTFTNEAALANSWHLVVMAKSEMGNTILFMLSGIAGTMMVIFLSRNVAFLNRIFGKIGRYSLTIMAIHMFVLDAFQRRIKNYTLGNVEGLVIIVIVTIATLVISYFISRLFLRFVSKLQYMYSSK